MLPKSEDFDFLHLIFLNIVSFLLKKLPAAAKKMKVNKQMTSIRTTIKIEHSTVINVLLDGIQIFLKISFFFIFFQAENGLFESQFRRFKIILRKTFPTLP